jgi:hypothetical protein
VGGVVRPIAEDSVANWTPEDLAHDSDWIVELDDQARQDIVRAVRLGFDAEKSLFDYNRNDFDFGRAHAPISRAFEQAKHARGIALLSGLPRAELTEQEFSVLSWAIGLHVGVARPQGKTSQYLAAVRDVGVEYRSSGGRGYSSNAELDFHIDGVDVVALSCFNKALSGGMSMVSSSLRAHNILVRERPDLAEVLYEPFFFSRQAEEAPDEEPFYANPVFDVHGGAFFGKWNRNRINTAQKLEGVPKLSALQREAMDVMDETLRRPDVMYTMFLEPGDVQILSNFTTLHSRTEFIDHEAPEEKRVLFRLWLTPPDAPSLPPSWKPLFRSVRERTVRGGIIGQNYNDACRAFDACQAAEHSMFVES